MMIISEMKNPSKHGREHSKSQNRPTEDSHPPVVEILIDFGRDTDL